MLFNSFWYLVFLPIVVTLFWVSPRRIRTFLLLVASYVFYMSWKPIYGILIFGMTLANYFFGLAIARSEQRKKRWLIGAVVFNLVLLGVFKYAYFSWDLASAAGNWFGKQLPAMPWQIILPLGISFFVFEFIHYATDVYKGGRPVRSFIDFALFASFFPTQIAGPIKRYQDFIPQLANDHKLSLKEFDDGMWLIIFGLFKKVVFADNLSVVAQSAFSRPDLLTGFDLWFAVYAFAFQIYFDFSGYTDIARGSAMLLGYKVPPNFDLPYLSTSISDFWRRWHISLSTWLRDYLFIPLGGSRGSKWFTMRNLMLTMVLGGLWHGAALHFVVWGAYQGVMLIIHKEVKRVTDAISWIAVWKTKGWFKVASIAFTFQLVCIGWVFFRADNFDIAMQIIRKLLFIDVLVGVPTTALTIVNTTDPVIFMLLPFILLVLFGGQILSGWLAERKKPLAVPLPLKAVGVAAIICLLLVFSPDTSPKFIYFQF
ncbi:MAG TPA: MBOAT family O-acyltransferase [Candidatus Obscuribacterales bacterium]